MFTQNQFDELFPCNKYIKYYSFDLDEVNIPKYQKIWNYSNKILMVISTVEHCYSESSKSYSTYTQQTYHSFIKDNDGFIKFITSNTDVDRVLNVSKDVWDPPQVSKTTNRKELALEMIEDIILGALKNNKTKDLKKSSLSYIYYGSDGAWHAYYPDNQTLIAFHLLRNESANKSYIDFLYSEELKSLREEWNKTEGIIPGQ